MSKKKTLSVILLSMIIAFGIFSGCGSSQKSTSPDEETAETTEAVKTEEAATAEETSPAEEAAPTRETAETAEQTLQDEPAAPEPAGIDFSETPAPDMTGINVKESDVKSFEGHSYYFLMVPGRKPDIQEAEAICRELGGHLCTITSREEQEFVGTIYAESPWHEAVGTWYAMLGAYRENSSEPWKWVTGEEFTYTDDLPQEDSADQGDDSEVDWIGIMDFSKYSGGNYYEGPFDNWYIVRKVPGSEYDSHLLLVEWDD